MKIPTTLSHVVHYHTLELQKFVEIAPIPELIKYSGILHDQSPELVKCNKWDKELQYYSDCPLCEHYSLVLATIAGTSRPELKDKLK
ncbi:hypothetical protein GNP84_06525 [Aliivibrio fischeri]|uniref:hypothetical protein n=1 Tax=Aliivibrio fischeri TaxID=668 RepID=UPI0012D93159|nr:hypothetical protein [Aliivibrio fischeri]MUK76560.1 hypothetical protein [Aliivibrio fischeri]